MRIFDGAKEILLNPAKAYSGVCLRLEPRLFSASKAIQLKGKQTFAAFGCERQNEVLALLADFHQLQEDIVKVILQKRNIFTRLVPTHSFALVYLDGWQIYESHFDTGVYNLPVDEWLAQDPTEKVVNLICEDSLDIAKLQALVGLPYGHSDILAFVGEYLLKALGFSKYHSLWRKYRSKGIYCTEYIAECQTLESENLQKTFSLPSNELEPIHHLTWMAKRNAAELKA